MMNAAAASFGEEIRFSTLKGERGIINGACHLVQTTETLENKQTSSKYYIAWIYFEQLPYMHCMSQNYTFFFHAKNH